MKHWHRWIVASVLWAAAAQAGDTWQLHPEWAAEFEAQSVSGTMLVYDERAARYAVHDRKRAETPFSPASTFKLFNALAALETGVIADERETLRWDGTKRWKAEWNRDHDLASGMTHSVVWYYQELARRVGPRRMQHWIDAVGYGNRDIGGGIDRFWLGSSLKISAVGQIAFLRRLAAGTLPFSTRSQDIVRRITIVEETPDYTLHAKTGWTSIDGRPDLGWYVGWVERGGRRWFFALNIDVKDGDAPKRAALAKTLLVNAGALPRGAQ
ncbi:MAG TPA: class D beta-lactamase [Tahibacter sp.]|uniref:class D beta-lactamase n=1 Tax=Tahibacter sp. TaxID=2056211 RepID=UPI002BC7A3D9|nr:class D beta-lactamase [Tahibacter sp.]HSX61425.1 class D beta-lactamase [Tahibacter sp.]